MKRMRLSLMVILTALVALFSSVAFAKDWTINVSGNGDPFASSEAGRRDALSGYIGSTGMFQYLADGDTITVNWSGGWRSVWSVSKSGTIITLSETSPPVQASERYTFADQQRFCQNSATIVVDGYWEDWEIVTNGTVTSSGSDFVATGYTSTSTGLCHQNI